MILKNKILMKIMNLDFVNVKDINKDLIEKIRNWRNNKNISRYMLNNRYINREEHKSWIEKLKKEENLKAWVIKFNDKPIGFVSLSNINWDKKTTDWGFYIYKKSARGKGLGSSSLFKLMCIVFDEMNFQKMRTYVLDNNTIAKHLYEKFGFKSIKKTDEVIRNNKKIDVYLMEIDKEKWIDIKNDIKCTIKFNIINLILCNFTFF